MVNSTAERLKWFVLYYFIIEMREVKVKLEAQSVKHYRQIRKKHLYIKWIVYGSCLILSAAVLTINIFRHYNDMNKGGPVISESLRTLMIVFRTLKLTLDVSMFAIFMQVLLFFKRTKEAKFTQAKETLPRLHQFLSSITIALACLNLYHAVSSWSFYLYNYLTGFS